MKGVISAGGPETAAAGAAMLQAGGNAVDAAVAAAFVSFIAEVGVVHLGGSGLAHLYDSRTGRSLVYDFFSNMPGLGRDALPDRLDFEKVVIDFGATTQDFHLGRASVAVPGNIFGLCRLAADHGRLPLPTLLAPALALARDGLAIASFQAETCDLLKPLYTHTPGMRQIFTRDGRVIQGGEHLFIPDLAETLEQLAAEGVDIFRTGGLAQRFVADQVEHGGLVTAEDLRRYEVRPCPPIRLPYRDVILLLPRPSSTGGVLIAFTMKILAAFDLPRMTPGSTCHLQLFYEATSAAMRARSRWEELLATHAVGDAVDLFLADSIVAPAIDEVAEALHTGRRAPVPPAGREPGHTSHLSVIDSDGLAVGLTTTAGESAGYVLPGTGFIPNNILGEADLNPHGFHQWPAGQRIPTMMAPTMVLQDGQIRLVVGSGGSERIRSAIVQVLTNWLDFGLSLSEAVQRSRYHVENGVLQCEAGFDETAVAELEQRGYRVNRWPRRSIYFGGAHSVAMEADGQLVAAGDDRRGGSTVSV